MPILYISCCLLQQVVLLPQALWFQSPVNHPLPGPVCQLDATSYRGRPKAT